MNDARAVPEKILIVDDTPANMSILVDLLEPHGYAVSAAPNGVVALHVAAKLIPDIILLDVMMPELDGLETCRRLKADPITAHVPVLFISARDDAASLLEGFRAGGADFVVKPFQPEEVLARVRAHLKLSSLTRELKTKNDELTAVNQQLVSEITRRRQADEALHAADQRLSLMADTEDRRWGIEQFVGKSAMLMKILATIRRLTNFSTVNVLITGESGTGKELVARAIHQGTPGKEGRRRGPFVVVNCVAIPEESAESLLFGHVSGAFAGATSDRKGLFELADTGTLFLDEVGGMPLTLQTKLLRVLEDGQFMPVGSGTTKKVDVRVLAATNADLQQLVAEGKFRPDLYFRLAQFTVAVPPLRERQSDVPLLAEHFANVFSREMGLRPVGISGGALDLLQSYPFPGNVRELKNIIERALIESSGREITPEHLQLSNLHAGPAAEKLVRPQPTTEAPAPSADLPLNLEEAEATLIQRALAQTGGNIARAAQLLGVNRSRIYRRLQ
jgi:DNA-binding NtrC family response regulator